MRSRVTPSLHQRSLDPRSDNQSILINTGWISCWWSLTNTWNVCGASARQKGTLLFIKWQYYIIYEANRLHVTSPQTAVRVQEKPAFSGLVGRWRVRVGGVATGAGVVRRGAESTRSSILPYNTSCWSLSDFTTSLSGTSSQFVAVNGIQTRILHGRSWWSCSCFTRSLSGFYSPSAFKRAL